MPSSSHIETFKETGEHSYHRRAFNHDYFAPFIYHIILKKQKNCECFGEVKGDAKIPYGAEGCAAIEESSLGKIIAKAIIHLKYEFPIIKIHQYKVMPDHVHLLLQILFRSDKHLEFYIEKLLERIAKKYGKIRNKEISETEIFEEGFCDKPLYDERSLDGWYDYIKENPHRLAMRIQYPRFFQRIRNLKIGEKEYEGYGNFFLFRNPDKVTVKMSDKFSDDLKREKIKFFSDSVSSGSILVSPFIHPDEKVIRAAAEGLGGKIILIQHEEFGEIFKPARYDFNQCSQGNLLIISLGYPKNTSLSKAICKEMNELASKITLLF